MIQSAALFGSRPWRDVEPSDLKPVLSVPSMLAEEETKFYYWLGETFSSADASFVDLGCFIGGSAARFAGGIMAAEQPTKVYAYDRFRVDEALKQKMLYKRGVKPFEGNDMLPTAKKLLKPFADHIEFRRGDIEDSEWTNGAISVLAHDASKSRASMDRQAEIFWGSLREGRSVVVQQDYLHTTQPWVPVQMELWADHFEPVAFVRGSSLVFVCTKTPSQDLLALRRVANLPHQDQVELMASAQKRMAQFGDIVVEKLQEARDLLEYNPGVDRPWQMKRAA